MKHAAKSIPVAQPEQKRLSVRDPSLKTEDPDPHHQSPHSPTRHLSGPKIKVDTDAYSHHIE